MTAPLGFSRAALAACIVLGTLAGAWGGGLLMFATSLEAGVEDRDTVTDAIVVLTGGSDRLSSGLALLEAGKGRKLFISGVHKGVDLTELLRQAHPQPAEAPCCIVLGHTADDTAGNAAETAAWMETEHFTSLRLVTASYHMRRSILEFRRAMPKATIVAHPVFPDAFKREQWWRWPGTAHLLATEYTKYLAALARRMFIPKTPERKP
ncbi:MAG: YdcF family protein [Magnetospirillum sp.]|nr:MAG: YdcF family protein [Magnetospirillum sp.]